MDFKKLLVTPLMAAVMILGCTAAGAAADGFDCLQYLYGTWGHRNSDIIFSFTYEAVVVPPEPGTGKKGYEYDKYTGIDNAHVNDTTRAGQLDLIYESGRTDHIEFIDNNTIKVWWNGQNPETYTRVSTKSLDDK